MELWASKLGHRRTGLKMPKVECSIVINRPIDKVFAYTTNPANYINWQPWILDSQSDRRISIGTRIEVLSRFMGRKLDMTTEVTEYVPNKRIVMLGVRRSFFTKVVYKFERDNGATKVNYMAEFQPRGLLELLGSMTVHRFRKQTEDSFWRLKGILEAEF
jgi:carbon monoxide dehydrogenase subunit G